MLNPRVCRFVVDQKEKYWANHSWRWASAGSMAESFVSGGLQAGVRRHNNKSSVTLKPTSQDVRGKFTTPAPGERQLKQNATVYRYHKPTFSSQQNIENKKTSCFMKTLSSAGTWWQQHVSEKMESGQRKAEKEAGGGTCCWLGQKHDWEWKRAPYRGRVSQMGRGLAKLSRLWMCHRLQNMIWSEDSGNISVHEGSSGSSALKTDLILSWESLEGAQEHFQESLSVNTAHRNTHIYEAEKKNMIQKHCRLLWTQTQMDQSLLHPQD